MRRADNEYEIAIEVAIHAILEYRATIKLGASDIQKRLADEMGYSGATDELVSFLHSHFLRDLLDDAGIEPERVFKQLCCPMDGCTCASCTGYDEPIVWRGGDILSEIIRRTHDVGNR